MWSTSVEHAGGSAQRRRQRRLRQWLRHERMTSGSPARPRRQPMAAPPGLMTAATLGRWLLTRRKPRSGSTCALAPAVGALSRAVAGGARGQGLGIPWRLLGCPCRLRGRLNILESTVSSSRTSGWGPVVMQWQVPLQGGCLRRRWKNSTYFLREAGLCIFLRALVSGIHSPMCSYISPWLLMEEFHTPAARRENLDIISTNPSFPAGVTFHRNAWLYSGYMFCVSLRELMASSPHFLRGGVLGS